MLILNENFVKIERATKHIGHLARSTKKLARTHPGDFFVLQGGNHRSLESTLHAKTMFRREAESRQRLADFAASLANMFVR